MINMGQMILSKPSIIIIWTYQDMMEWMSRMLVGEMAGANEHFGLEYGDLNFGNYGWFYFSSNFKHNDEHRPDDPFRTITYHHQDISGHDGMDEQDVGLIFHFFDGI
jgi:hypothetical protein